MWAALPFTSFTVQYSAVHGHSSPAPVVLPPCLTLPVLLPSTRCPWGALPPGNPCPGSSGAPIGWPPLVTMPWAAPRLVFLSTKPATLRPPSPRQGFVSLTFLLCCPSCCRVPLPYCPTVPSGLRCPAPAGNCTATQALQIPPPPPASPQHMHASPIACKSANRQQAEGSPCPLFGAIQPALDTADAVRTANSGGQYRQACQRGSWTSR